MQRNILLTIILFFAVIAVYGQNDTMYVMKDGAVTYKLSVKPEDVDSIIFYQPPTQAENTVTDADGNVYQTVTIGTQVWMTENLKTTKYNDGTDIPLVTDGTEWSNLATPAYCWYNNDEATYKNPYGALYNWYAVNTEKLCPVGWHVSTDAEWTTLVTDLGGKDVAGGKLKESGTAHWSDPNTGATNESGFTAVPGGERTGNVGKSDDMGTIGWWWTATAYDGTRAKVRNMLNTGTSVGSITYGKKYGLSVRCVKD